MNAAGVAPMHVGVADDAACAPAHDPGLPLGSIHFNHHDLGQTVSHVFNVLRFDNENRFVTLILGKAELVTHHRIRLFSMGTALYGLLCSVEGTGLLLRKTWAEYLTLWLSVSFVPWEAYEVVWHGTLWRWVILMMNLAITAYLVWMLRRKRHHGTI